MTEQLTEVDMLVKRIEICRECEYPVVVVDRGSVNGGDLSYGCARCSFRKREALTKELADLHAGNTLPRWASENMPTMEEVKARAQLRSRP